MTATQTQPETATSIFTDAVSDAELARIYDLAKFAPTALNSQPLRITFVRTEAARERLLPLLSEGNRAKAASAPVVAILAADTDFHEHLPLLAPQNAGARDGLAADRTRREAMARNNAWLQAGAFILAVRAAGLDAGPMGGIDAGAIDREFLAGTPLRTFLVVNIGHAAADGTFPRNPRLGFDQAVTLV
jgi:3-hydroxypropanoate dehydrogenase